MNLLQLRTQFVNESGRHDLVTDIDTYADNGADFYINAGQRLLDRLDQTHKSTARVFRLTEIGDYGVTFPSCRSVQQVWVGDLTARQKIDKVSMNDLREQYFNLPINQIVRSTPTIWAPVWTRTSPDRITAAEFSAFAAYADVPVGETARQIYNGVLWMPPAERQYQVEIVGLFYTADLSADDHISYWTEVHPELLVMAAMAVLEITYRNRQGYTDWMAAINNYMMTIGFDLVEEDISDVEEMEG